MDCDTGIKEAVTETQLHEHQDSSEANASQGNGQPSRLTAK
jgi:hypothetical protein